MHLLLTGATGLVGGASLNTMIRNPAITKITIFSRKPVPQAEDTEAARKKSTVITHSNFDAPPSSETLDTLKDARGCVWALGVSQNDVDASTYEKITVQLPLSWARAFADAGLGSTGDTQATTGPFNFVYVSGEGATVSPGFATPRFGRVKGHAESSLLKLGKEKAAAGLRVYSARPAGVDRTGHDDLNSYITVTGAKKYYEKPMLAALRTMYKAAISPTPALGDALVQLAASDGEAKPEGPGVSGEGRTLSNVHLRKMAGL